MARRLLIPLAFLVAIHSSSAIQAEEANACFSDWSSAAPVVSREGLATVEQLTRRARGKVFGRIVKTELCRDSGAYVYRLVVQEPSGRLSRVTVDARHPFED